MTTPETTTIGGLEIDLPVPEGHIVTDIVLIASTSSMDDEGVKDGMFVSTSEMSHPLLLGLIRAAQLHAETDYEYYDEDE